MSSILAQLKFYYNEYGFQYMIYISIIFIILLGLYNLLTRNKGKYTWYKNTSSSSGDEYIYNITSDDANTSKLELKSKIILETIFKKPFVRIRPDFLKNKVTGKNMELDIYNEELKLAIEVNGNQHYKYIPYFHGKENKHKFYEQRYRDELKKLLCKENGITLIEIPYDVGEYGLKSYILQQLRLNKFYV